jgi:hypothetical protein
MRGGGQIERFGRPVQPVRDASRVDAVPDRPQPAGGQPVGPGEQFVYRVGGGGRRDHETLIQQPAPSQRAGDSRERKAFRRDHPGHLAGVPHEGIAIPAGQYQDLGVAGRRRVRPGRGGRLLEDHMRVGAPEPESAHAGPPRCTRRAPFDDLGRHGEPGRAQVQLGGRPEVRLRNDDPVAYHQGGLDQAGDTGRDQGMAEDRLGRSEPGPSGPLAA